ncbi:hypothetical protein TNCV_4217761 [Trichonephila clavipes]|nr:hypothetical protein TNCV_4217761 [Trichonephila clavipes]
MSIRKKINSIKNFGSFNVFINATYIKASNKTATGEGWSFEASKTVRHSWHLTAETAMPFQIMTLNRLNVPQRIYTATSGVTENFWAPLQSQVWAPYVEFYKGKVPNTGQSRSLTSRTSQPLASLSSSRQRSGRYSSYANLQLRNQPHEGGQRPMAECDVKKERNAHTPSDSRKTIRLRLVSRFACRLSAYDNL